MKKIIIDDGDWCKNCKLVNMYNELIEINNQHQEINGKLRVENKELLEQKKNNKNVKTIELIFENCEVCELTADEIVVVSFDGLYKNLTFDTRFNEKSMSETYNCKEICLVLNQKALNKNFSSATLEERIDFKDIAFVTINFDDDTSIDIGVEWKDNMSEYTNANQYNLYCDGDVYGVDDDEVMVVVIKEGLTIGELDSYV